LAEKNLEPRSAPRQARSRKRVGLILDTAEQLVMKNGYEVVTTQMIAKATGISPGVLYHYFPGKFGIFAAVVKRAFERLETRMRESFTDVLGNKSYPELIDWVVDDLIEYWQENKAAMLMWQSLQHAPQMDPVTNMLKKGSIMRNIQMIRTYFPEMDQKDLKIKALVMEEVSVSLLRQSLLLKGKQRQLLGRELKLLLIELMGDFETRWAEAATLAD
jgi:AcrR family transcriptional regulator